ALQDLYTFPTRRSSDLPKRISRSNSNILFQKARRRTERLAAVSLLILKNRVYCKRFREVPHEEACDFTQALFFDPVFERLYVRRSEEHTSELQSRFDLV